MLFVKSQRLTVISAAFLTLVSGCAVFETAESRSYATVVASPQRDTEEARRRNNRAIRFFKEGNLQKARVEADQALIANVDFAPAHNTLGRILFSEGKYYLAAWEYQFAIQLQPNMPEYYNNLGLVYEAADRLPEAIGEFQNAVDLKPDNYHFVSNLARAKTRSGEVTPETAALLREVVFMDPRKEWKDWAGELLNTNHLDQPSGYMHHASMAEGISGDAAWGSFEEGQSSTSPGIPIAVPSEELPKEGSVTEDTLAIPR